MQKYDICIIAVAEDVPVAKKLAESLSKYKLPSGIVLPDSKPDYRRVIVNVSGKPFDNEARSLLDSSRCLVVFCSPEIRNDTYILESLSYFREIGKSDNIIPVLVRGEPQDSFSGLFTEQKTVRQILPDMTVIERVETIEPVASDLRADTPSRFKEVLSYETVRIVASALGIHPDKLEQRHRMRRRRAVIMLVSVVAGICLTAACIFAFLGYIARKEGQIAEQQAELCIDIAERTMNELPAAFAGEPQALEYIEQAVEKAKQSLEKLELDEMVSDDQAVTGG